MKGAISMKKIAVIGLGLMGASIAKAYKKTAAIQSMLTIKILPF